jgi:hypothetical protein
LAYWEIAHGHLGFAGLVPNAVRNYRDYFSIAKEVGFCSENILLRTFQTAENELFTAYRESSSARIAMAAWVHLVPMVSCGWRVNEHVPLHLFDRCRSARVSSGRHGTHAVSHIRQQGVHGLGSSTTATLTILGYGRQGLRRNLSRRCDPDTSIP